MANFSVQLNSNNKIAVRNILNINTTNYTALRTGQEFLSSVDNIRSRELAFKTNTFFSTQITGEHNISQLKTRLGWYGSFNILDRVYPRSAKT